jgi:hypothetical protein
MESFYSILQTTSFKQDKSILAKHHKFDLLDYIYNTTVYGSRSAGVAANNMGNFMRRLKSKQRYYYKTIKNSTIEHDNIDTIDIPKKSRYKCKNMNNETKEQISEVLKERKVLRLNKKFEIMKIVKEYNILIKANMEKENNLRLSLYSKIT